MIQSLRKEVSCPECGVKYVLMGQILDSSIFAGITVEKFLKGGKLY